MASGIYFKIEPRSGQWRALCRSLANDQLIWWSELYRDKRDAQNAIDLLRVYAANAPQR